MSICPGFLGEKMDGYFYIGLNILTIFIKLVKLAKALGIFSYYLTKGTFDDLTESSLTDKDLLNQFKSIEKLPDANKNVVKFFLDAFITKKKLKQLAL